MSRNKEHTGKKNAVQDQESVLEASQYLDEGDEGSKGLGSQGKAIGDAEHSNPERETAVEVSIGEGKDGDDYVKESQGKHGGSGRKSGGRKGTMQKRVDRASRKELLELIRRKNDMLQDMERKIGEAEKVLKNKDDRILRIVAEFENYKKRTRREWELHKANANAELIGEILGVLDDLDRALEAAGDGGDHFQSGVRMIYTALMNVLNGKGLKEVGAEGQRFDPQFHEAVGEVESEDIEEGFVAGIAQKGYILGNHLLRPAKVMVAKKKE